MDRVAEPLTLMGAHVVGQGARLSAPLRVYGSDALRGIHYDVPMASAQVKSAILFAALRATSPTTVVEHVRTRPTTEEMLSRAGVAVVSIESGAGRSVTIQPGRPLARNWLVPGDPSQAAFFAVLGCIHPDADIEVLDIDGARERVGFLGVLQRMGATLALRASDTTTSFTVRSSQLTRHRGPRRGDPVGRRGAGTRRRGGRGRRSSAAFATWGNCASRSPIASRGRWRSP